MNIQKVSTNWLVLITSIFLIGLLLFSGCSEPSPEGSSNQTESIKIGVVAPMTGPASSTGTDMWQAAELAASEINANGGVMVNGQKKNIELVKGDTETNNEQGVKAVTRLITQDRVNLLVGGFSSSITYSDQVIASENKIPFIITGASSPSVTRRDDIDTSYFFHHCPTTLDHAEAAMLFTAEEIRPKVNEKFGFSKDRKLRVGVLYQDGKYGEGIYEGAKKAIEDNNLKLEIVAVETFTRSETDYRSALTSLKQKGVDVVYPAAFLNEQIPIVTQGRKDVGLNSIFLSVDCNDDPQYYSGVGKWGDYSILESRFSPYTVPQGEITEDVIEFRNKFKDEYGIYPGAMGASTYEGIYIAVRAIEEADSLKKEDIRDSLNALEMPEIVEAMKNHTIEFDQKHRESDFQIYMQQLRFNESVDEPRPEVVWPNRLEEDSFVLPEWYEPSSKQ